MFGQSRKRTSEKVISRQRRHFRIRKKVAGDSQRPRFCITRSNRALTAQIINDEEGKTLVSARTPMKKVANVDLAKKLGEEIAQKAKQQGIAKVVFDRGGYIYHGKIAAVADGARSAGLEF
ncbi:MAG: 50S ribosomal protein L18 [Proteobacteria bacterium]|jgi:large subunit ribosomal protein L18|nr:50S ribosomal protein L18 [Pseudomonadota bacterium]